MISVCYTLFVTTLNPSETFNFMPSLLWCPQLTIPSFPPQGARGNDGLPGPAGPPVRIIVLTLHLILFYNYL